MKLFTAILALTVVTGLPGPARAQAPAPGVDTVTHKKGRWPV